MPKTVRQRADLTFKHNKTRGRHGWLRLTPAYSMKLVRQIVHDHPEAERIFDPFSGTGTTPLCAAEFGKTGVSTDVNPFLVWLGNTKAARYDAAEIDRMVGLVRKLSDQAASETTPACDPPPIRNIERWWPQESLRFLCRLKTAIDRHGGDHTVYNLLRIVFCRTLIALSNAAFNHQSMSFEDQSKAAQLTPLVDGATHRKQLVGDVSFVAEATRENPPGSAEILLGDARDLNVLAERGCERFDLLITSPPYPNRMSYIRELRPYMYWLSYLVEAREAGELDWEAIGGTWGVATSRLKDWEPDPGITLPDYLFPILDGVRGAHARNGILMANYIHRYFEDMARHFAALPSCLKPGAGVHYIVGNSTFYGHVVPAERIYADLLTTVGFEEPKWEVIRKRNSKKELFEFDVTARWPG